ncbi:MAG: hypothetical protein FWD80_02975 [Propionibacteriaceae bacterium]|nr:hypothetical protein [Propionibacteriaceae bacterium]
MDQRSQQVACEDVLLFVNAAIASTGQREFASTADEHVLSLQFLHAYMLANYRDLYASSLAVGINDFNAALIIVNLLGTPHTATVEQRSGEGPLIAARLSVMPPQRVYRLFARLRRAGVNNRRTRAIIRDWLAARPDLAFDAVKYRRGLAGAARHSHMQLPDEVGKALFDWSSATRFDSPVLEAWRRAHYDKSALAELPYTVAEGFAGRRGVSRKALLTQARLTAGERLRLQSAADRTKVEVSLDLAGMPLTRLATYILSLERPDRARRSAELTDALRAAAARVAGPHRGTWGRVVTVGDDSYSSAGSGVKRRRPLAVALAVHYLAEALAVEHDGLWLVHRGDPLLVHPIGTTPLASRLLDALALAPDRLIVVSDAWDNDPPGGASEVLRVWRERVDPDSHTEVVHLNPVYDPRDLMVRPLAPGVPSVGIRDGEDAATLVEVARFATGLGHLDELTGYFATQVSRLLSNEAVAGASAQAGGLV